MLSSLAVVYALCALVVALASNSIPIDPLHYNYVVDVEIYNATANLIVDTGNSEVTFLLKDPLYPYNGSSIADASYCTNLSEDNTLVQFVTNPSQSSKPSCYRLTGLATLGGSVINETYIGATKFFAENDVLHNWNSSYGDLGMSYPYSQNRPPLPATNFQAWLSNFSATQFSTNFENSSYVFGLDFNPSGFDSSMQLASVLPDYQANITWMAQPTDTPVYHTFFMNDLQFCGQSLFGNYSSNWPVLVDTGSVCLTLPAEFYDTMTAWTNQKANINQIDQLPALTFTLSTESGETMYLPLSSLFVNKSIFDTETAQTIDFNGQDSGLCVLRGSSIGSFSSSGGALSMPYIVFGTTVLHSFYFAADFQSKVVGIAPKANSTSYKSNIANNQIYNTPGHGICAARVLCKGSQIYEPKSNTCQDPVCSNYFFLEIEDSSKTCVFKSSAVGVGFFILVLISFMEACHYFVLEYTTWQSLDRNQEVNDFAVSRISPISVAIGRGLSKVVDFIVVRVLKWHSGHARPNAAEEAEQSEPLQGNGMNFEARFRNRRHIQIGDDYVYDPADFEDDPPARR